MDKVYIVSHTHWDREWYATREEYRWYLVRTLDALLDAFERDERFMHFHLDGQTVMLDDYLQIRPQNRPRLEKLIREGRLAVGPWYVLQDEFLTSGEANVRNLLRGLQAAQALGGVAKVGYLPDTFGHFSQMPQLLRGFGIDNAIFCRGLSAGYDTMRCDKTARSATECIWQGSDGSEVLGVFGSEWYNNLNELNADAPAAHICSAVENLRRAARTNCFLLFNGCDHQPLQRNLPDLLAQALPALSNMEVHWAGFSEFVDSLRAAAQSVQLPQVTGELTSQDTDGLFSFVHTASTRPQIKRDNVQCQNLLEAQAEPISVFAALEGKPYDRAYTTYCWELLMQNHAHDSICGCGVDPVYREMALRFSQCKTAADLLTHQSARYIADRIAGDGLATLVVFNAATRTRSEVVTAQVNLPLEGLKKDATFAVTDGEKVLPANVLSFEPVFRYELPEDSFRRAITDNRLTIEFLAENLPAFGYASYTLRVCNKASAAKKTVSDPHFENEFYAFTLRQDGSFDVTDKRTGHSMCGCNAFEDTGNVGNEYTYFAPLQDERFTTEGQSAHWTATENDVYRRYTVTHELDVPVGFTRLEGAGEDKISYDGSLSHAQKKTCSRRSTERTRLTITAAVTLYRHSPRIEIHSYIHNTARNHRVRALFPHGITAEGVVVHTPFDFVYRSYNDKPHWQLSDKSDRMQAFCGVRSETSFLLASRGVHEYEAKPNCLYATLLSAVDEMGDWGDFPTPDAQCLGVVESEYALIVGCPFEEAARQALDYAQEAPLCVAADGKGTLPAKKRYLTGCEHTVFSAFKQAEDDAGFILRVYNPFDTAVPFAPALSGYAAKACDLAECVTGSVPETIAPKKIVTVKFEKENGKE